MTSQVTHILQNNDALSDVDFVMLCLATNASKNFIVVEALAGTGKTTLLLDVLRRLDIKRCLFLSFARNAIRVIRVRYKNQTGEWVQSQTFDSLFLHLNGKKAKLMYEEPTFQTYRDMIYQTTLDDIREFICRTREVNYNFEDFDYLFVDEAQDSPPGAFHFLDLCRQHGKQIVITGDRHQAIFQFQDSINLFDSIPRNLTILHHLNTTRRLTQPLCDFANNRWNVTMTSSQSPIYQHAYHDVVTGTIKYKPLDISIQCRYNRTLAQVYVALLTTVRVHIRVNINAMQTSPTTGDGDDITLDKFYTAAWEEVMNKYSVNLDKAKLILTFMEERARVAVGPWITISTVHRYKGDESDLSILGPDIDVAVRSHDQAEENVKYVAWTRARYGVLQLAVPEYLGDQRLIERTANTLLTCALFQYPRVMNVTKLVNSPVIAIVLMGNPHTRHAIDLVRACYREHTSLQHEVPSIWVPTHTCNTTTLVGLACDVALCWYVERACFTNQIFQVRKAYPEFTMTVLKDHKLRRMVSERTIPEAVVRTYARLLRRIKLRALLCKHLVVHHGFPLSHSVVVRGVMAHAILQTFAYSYSILALRRFTTIGRCCVRDYCATITTCLANLPPLLRDATNWSAVDIHGEIPADLLQVRGTFDIVILDKQSQRHMIELKCVKKINFAYFWQTAMYTVLSRLNANVTMHHTCIFSIRDQRLYHLNPQHLAEMTQTLATHPNKFNEITCISQDTRFYPKDYDIHDLVLQF